MKHGGMIVRQENDAHTIREEMHKSSRTWGVHVACHMSDEILFLSSGVASVNSRSILEIYQHRLPTSCYTDKENATSLADSVDCVGICLCTIPTLSSGP